MALMQEKQVAAVTFSRCDYPWSSQMDQIPWCKFFARFVEMVSLPEDTDCGIILSVCTADGTMGRQVFTGVEDEDFALLFRCIYEKLRSDGEPDADAWLSRHLNPVYSDWQFNGETYAERSGILNEVVGLITNGKDHLFYRVDREFELRGKRRVFTDLGDFLIGELELVSYPWNIGNDALLIRSLNETKPGEGFYKSVAERFTKDIRHRYFSALVAFFKHKGVFEVVFDESDYFEIDDENLMPWCEEVDRFVERLRLVTGDDGLDRIVIAVRDADDSIIEKAFSGDDNENWITLYNEAYNRLWDGGVEDEEADCFLENFGGSPVNA